VFETSDEHWQMMNIPVEMCDPVVLNSYRQQFPQLWKNHNLVIRLDQLSSPYNISTAPLDSVQANLRDRPSQGFDRASATTDTNMSSQGYVLRLFVTRHHAQTTQILENLHRLLDQVLDVPYTLKVIDVTQHPERAEADQITATPTLVKVWPKPIRRLVGNQLETDTIMQLLDTSEVDTTAR